MRAELEDDGVVLARQILPRDMLRQVIYEYEGTSADITDMPKHAPVVVFWTHVVGEKKRLKLLNDMPWMHTFAKEVASLVRPLADGELRLLETIIFNKPPGVSNTLRWHQDVSYFPFAPNNQLAVWIPFDKVTQASGAMIYALGTHKMELRASTDLHSGEVFKDDRRTPIPDDPQTIGIRTQVMEMDLGDMLIHEGRTWHMSGPNTVAGQQRRGLSLRFLVGETRYDPRPGSAAAFLKQIDDLAAGDLIADEAFPLI